MERIVMSKSNFECSCGYKFTEFVWSDRDKDPLCPLCKGEKVFETILIKNESPAHMKFASSTPDERKKILKKRSHEHYEKEIKPKIKRGEI